MYYSFIIKTLVIATLLHMPVAAFAVELHFGRSERWQRFVGLDNVEIIDDHTDNSYVQLAPISNTELRPAELYLDFEEPYTTHSFPLYALVAEPNMLLGQPKVGRYSGLFTTKTSPLVWFPKNGSVLSSQTDNTSFTIQLWTKPNMHSGIIMSWRSLSVIDGQTAPYIDFARVDNSFVWNINNIFTNTQDNEPVSAHTHRLLATKTDGRDNWSHHHLQYNAQEHYITYRLDGVLVDISYTTDDKSATGAPVYKTIPPAFDGVLRIGASYSGLIDNFQIAADLKSPELRLFAGGVGTIQTDVIDLMNAVGYLNDIEIIAETPPHTEIVTEYRMSARRAPLRNNAIAWNRLQNNSNPPPGIVGKYLQLRISLYPDGSQEYTPVLHEVSVSIDPIQLPLAPQLLAVSAGDQKIVLSWKPQSLELGEVHYRVLFGTQEDILNRSISAGNDTSITVTGLENGQVYYFVVEPFLPNLGRIAGDKTEVVSARPFNPTPQP